MTVSRSWGRKVVAKHLRRSLNYHYWVRLTPVSQYWLDWIYFQSLSLLLVGLYRRLRSTLPCSSKPFCRLAAVFSFVARFPQVPTTEAVKRSCDSEGSHLENPGSLVSESVLISICVAPSHVRVLSGLRLYFHPLTFTFWTTFPPYNESGEC